MTCKLYAMCLVVLLAVVQELPAQTPLTAEFTYQGQLSAPGLPAITSADFQFALFDSIANGAQVGTMLPKDNVALANGAFTVQLDFGAQSFTGNARWLQVALRSPAGAGSYTTLSPRQSITVTPHATYSLQTRGIEVDESGRVGVGVSPNPILNTRLDVAGSVSVPSNSGFFTRNAAGTGVAGGVLANSNNDLSLFANGNELVHLDSDGRVGIAENHPAAPLHIRTSSTAQMPTLALEGPGRATLEFYPQGQGNALTTGDIGFPAGSNATFFIRNRDPAARVAFTGNEGTRYPSSGLEDLRVIRGRVEPNGDVVYGQGFTVTHLQEGVYRINFTPSFESFPVATANTISVDSSPPCFIEFTDATAFAITLQIVRRSDGNLVNNRFYFIAMGPRS